MPLADAFDGVRHALDNLSERERRLAAVLGLVLAALVILVPGYLLIASLRDLDDRAAEYREVLREIDRSASRLAEARAAAQAAEERYRTSAPPLRTFLARTAEAGTLTVDRVDDQPDRVSGGFKRRHVRAEIRSATLAKALRLIADIDGSPYPVAVERIDLTRLGAGDQYSVKVGVVTFDREGGARPSGEATATTGAPEPEP